ncbi:phenylalanine--tRNA ligase subunit beta [Hathewaya limosa]|uniref:Phenylalanine--tRNA ligase beta subunit n=1 Tax=Hathewaya limosa TaxID=1536 RepID=A0ABU0JU02_HATLI|nr:phenylalanine--tRNA ligase subunit beta [Hathewaya limosa]AWZ49134.1 phenylalanine--tRNA ligase subunit beta [Clostridiaceae bacterium 14S0207]MDQ0479618.1 phenylalanyl-tRNA synthetase beta chain [Hathewaya limosa]
MKVPYNWLKDYVNIDISPKELGDRLTLSGSKVEEVIITGAEIENIVTCKIEQIEKHPEADRLSICSVNIGKEENIQIVTAATNMKENDIVPVALHGATLFDGTKIKKGKLRGIVSNGMFCSEEEIGVADGKVIEGLMIMPEDTPIGKDIKEVLGLESAVIDFEITSNRPDCMSVLGIARETAATLGTSYKMPELTYTEDSSSNIHNELKVEVKDSLCKRYMTKAIKNVKIEPSPKWLQDRLIEYGIKPKNNIVDITNFVMVELGQPMHAFDRREIKNNLLCIERASEGEKFTTLDEVERTLDENTLCIKDGDRTVAIAGVMGGLNSEVKDDTTEIILECASFNPVSIRKTSAKLGLRTEASTKFEKELDPNNVETAMNRACNLIESLGIGKVVEGTIDIYNEKREPHTLTVDSKWINKFLGIDISKEEMKKVLDSLDLNTEVKEDDLVISVPTFRCDMNIKEDVAEEVARIYGYNKIPTTIPHCETLKGGKSEKQLLEEKVVDTLISCGLNQSISYSFISPKVFDKLLIAEDSSLRNVVKIKNPLGEDFSVMRTTSVGSMMDSLGRNYVRSNSFARLFEMGKVYIKNEDENKIPTEKNVVTIGMYGNVDYLNLKGIVEELLETLGVKKVSFRRETENKSFHPGKTAALYIKNQYVGVVGEIHPDVCDNYEVEDRCYIAELDLDVIFKNANIEKKYMPLPKYPAVTRDIAILVDDEILVQEIEETIVKAGGNILESIELFDVYKGKQIPDGKKSVAYALIYRVPEKTLKDEEVNKVHNKILRALEHKLGAELR